MKRTRSDQDKPLSKKKKQNTHDQLFNNLPSEMIDIILDYSEIRDGLAFISTSKQVYNHHKDHPLFSASKWIQTMGEQLSPYHVSLFERASKFVNDQHRATNVKKKDKSKVKYLLKLIRKKHGKTVSRELKEKLFKKLKYSKVDHLDMNRELQIGNYLIIHTSDYAINIRSYESQDANMWYKCKIKALNGKEDEEEEYTLIAACTWLCDWQHSNNIDKYLNEIFSIDESINPALIAVCLVITGPYLTWACHSLVEPTTISPSGASPSDEKSKLAFTTDDGDKTDSAEQRMINSLYEHFTLNM